MLAVKVVLAVRVAVVVKVVQEQTLRYLEMVQTAATVVAVVKAALVALAVTEV